MRRIGTVQDSEMQRQEIKQRTKKIRAYLQKLRPELRGEVEGMQELEHLVKKLSRLVEEGNSKMRVLSTGNPAKEKPHQSLLGSQPATSSNPSAYYETIGGRG